MSAISDLITAVRGLTFTNTAMREQWHARTDAAEKELESNDALIEHLQDSIIDLQLAPAIDLEALRKALTMLDALDHGDIQFGRAEGYEKVHATFRTVLAQLEGDRERPATQRNATDDCTRCNHPRGCHTNAVGSPSRCVAGGRSGCDCALFVERNDVPKPSVDLPTYSADKRQTEYEDRFTDKAAPLPRINLAKWGASNGVKPEETQEWWAAVDRATAEGKNWPKWKKAGVNAPEPETQTCAACGGTGDIYIDAAFVPGCRICNGTGKVGGGK
jgi:hypothetical protein